MDGNSSKEGLAKKGQSDANDTTNLRKIKEEIIEDEDDQVVEEFFVNPELVEEESELQKKNDEDFKKEEKAEEEAVAELTESERFDKLMTLLKQSKFYSEYLLKKLENEDKQSLAIKEAKLKDRKVDNNSGDDSSSKKQRTRKRLQGAQGSESKKAKVEPRSFNGQPIPDDQPMLISGGVMRKYQLEGYKWMATLFENGINGILADEMGLGKTIQTIALFAHLVEMGVKGPFLIIAPLSTVPNWVKEINKFAPLLPVVLYHGSAVEREELRNKNLKKVTTITDAFSKPREVRTIFVTSYEIAMNDRVHMKKISWRYIVVDEGHRLKNSNCRLIKELKMYTSANRLLLTGTPLQNNLDELWSLLNFLMAEIFDDLRVFRSWFDAKNLDSESEDEKQRILQQERQNNILSTLHQILTPFLLRRVKADVDLDIPPKKELLVYCPMTKTQHDFYEATVNKTISQLVGQTESETPVEERNENGRLKRSAAQIDYKAFLELEGKTADENEDEESQEAAMEEYLKMVKAVEDRRRQNEMSSAYKMRNESSEVRISMKSRMMDLRKCTNHPYLIEYPLTDDGVYYLVNDDIVEKCGKMKVLDQMLKELIKRNHKVLIFSQMTRMLDILGDYLTHNEYKFSRLDGSMNFEDRQANIDQFNDNADYKIFLLSTRAGGLGINLTAADTCIIYDSDWNPQQDLQAQDRCHRIGQTRPVVIYRLVTAKTIDERIVERAAAKRKLEKMVIHHRKFKSQDKEGLSATMEALNPQELLDLLNSKDHAGIVDRQTGSVFSREELDLLLDRSDMKHRGNANKENQHSAKSSGKGKGKSIAKKKTSETNHFRVIDTDGMQPTLLKTIVKK